VSLPLPDWTVSLAAPAEMSVSEKTVGLMVMESAPRPVAISMWRMELTGVL
jgi:hypothetical protein